MIRSAPVMTAAALIAFLMAAVEAFAVVMSAHMPLATVMTTIVTLAVMVAVMVASGIGIILKRPLGKGLCRRIGGTGNTAVEANPRLGQRVLRAHANAAADQRVHLRRFQEAGQRAMAAAVGGHNLFGDDLAVRYVVELKLLRMAEMLEDFSILISCCDSHTVRSFQNDIFGSLIAELIVPAADQETLSVYQCLSHFPARALIDGCHGSAGNAHSYYRGLRSPG